jgi:hypothetical protein
VGISSSLCVGKEGEEGIKTLRSPLGAFDYVFLGKFRNLRRLCGGKGAKRFHFIPRAVVSYPTLEVVG